METSDPLFLFIGDCFIVFSINNEPEFISGKEGNLIYKWHGANLNNRFISSGTYYLYVKYKLPSGKILQIRKAISIKR